MGEPRRRKSNGRTNVSIDYVASLMREILDLKDSQMRLVDALKACKERNGE